jgi:hypothetical protein
MLQKPKRVSFTAEPFSSGAKVWRRSARHANHHEMFTPILCRAASYMACITASGGGFARFHKRLVLAARDRILLKITRGAGQPIQRSALSRAG